MDRQTENPGALAGATGADRQTKAASLRPEHSTNTAADANAPYHDAAIYIRTLCRAASPRWRAAIAWGALRELDPDDAAMVAAHFLPNDGAGPPIPAFAGEMAEASFWASMASPRELDAYCVATFTRMPAPRQSAFLAYVGRIAA